MLNLLFTLNTTPCSILLHYTDFAPEKQFPQFIQIRLNPHNVQDSLGDFLPFFWLIKWKFGSGNFLQRLADDIVKIICCMVEFFYLFILAKSSLSALFAQYLHLSKTLLCEKLLAN